jgi:hypothetical protein
VAVFGRQEQPVFPFPTARPARLEKSLKRAMPVLGPTAMVGRLSSAGGAKRGFARTRHDVARLGEPAIVEPMLVRWRSLLSQRTADTVR